MRNVCKVLRAKPNSIHALIRVRPTARVKSVEAMDVMGHAELARRERNARPAVNVRWLAVQVMGIVRRVASAMKRSVSVFVLLSVRAKPAVTMAVAAIVVFVRSALSARSTMCASKRVVSMIRNAPTVALASRAHAFVRRSVVQCRSVVQMAAVVIADSVYQGVAAQLLVFACPNLKIVQRPSSVH